MKSKKGQLGNLVPIIGTVVFVALLITVGFLVLQEFVQQDELKNPVTVTNETTTAINATPAYLSPNADGVRTDTFVLTAAWDSKSATIPLSNLSMNANTGTLTNVTMGGYASANISYTFQRGDIAYLGVNDTIEGLQTVPNLLGLLVLILLVGVVLAIVFNILPTGGRTIGA